MSWLEWLPVPVRCGFELIVEMLNQFFHRVRVPGLNPSLIGGFTPSVPMEPVWDRIGKCQPGVLGKEPVFELAHGYSPSKA